MGSLCAAMVLLDPLLHLSPGRTGPLLTFTAFYKWVMDVRDALGTFIHKVRKRSGLLSWARCIREDQLSHRAGGFVLTSSLILRARRVLLQMGLEFKFSLTALMRSFQKAWMQHFRRDGHPVVTLRFSWMLFKVTCLKLTFWMFLVPLGRIL